MNAAAYVRVSSRAQDHATQRAAIERVAGSRGDEIGTWYAEKKSARTIARAELARLREDAREGRVRRLYVFKLDQLARSGIRDTFEVVEELRAHGVQLVTISDGFDLDGPAAEGRRWGRPPRLSAREVAAIVADRNAGRTVREIAQAREVPRSTIGRVLSQNTGPDSSHGTGPKAAHQ